MISTILTYTLANFQLFYCKIKKVYIDLNFASPLFYQAYGLNWQIWYLSYFGPLHRNIVTFGNFLCREQNFQVY